MSGILYIVATPIGNLGDMTYRAVETLREADVIAAEDTRQTMKLLNKFEIKTKLLSFHMHSEGARVEQITTLLRDGKKVALVSDAGTPIISDPGDVLVRSALECGAEVFPIPGACAAIAALTVSAISAEEFAFFGFLPKQKGARREKLMQILSGCITSVIYESPHQLKKTLALIAEMAVDRQLAVAKELTKIHETVFRGTASEVFAILGDGDVRGEYVLILSGAEEQKKEASDEEIVAYLERLLKNGQSNKAAVKETASIMNVNRNKVYKLLLEKFDSADA